MPLYEYHCDDCQKDFEQMVRFAEADKLPACPECHSAHTRKKISRIATPGLNQSFGLPAASSCGSGGGRFG